MTLSQKQCVPCKGDTPTLSQAKIEEYLGIVDGWTQIGDSIERVVSLKDFQQAIQFVNKVAKIAEAEGHHPDIHVFDYKKVKLILTTHAVHGLTENDFILAAKIDGI